MKRNLMQAGEAQYVLRRALGPQRAWGDFLSDLARGRRPHFHGFRLLPCAYTKSRCRRPLYDSRDVVQFVQAVWAADPALKRKWDGVSVSQFEVVDEPLLPWSMREAQEVPLHAP